MRHQGRDPSPHPLLPQWSLHLRGLSSGRYLLALPGRSSLPLVMSICSDAQSFSCKCALTHCCVLMIMQLCQAVPMQLCMLYSCSCARLRVSEAPHTCSRDAYVHMSCAAGVQQAYTQLNWTLCTDQTLVATVAKHWDTSIFCRANIFPLMLGDMVCCGSPVAKPALWPR